ncbi:MAG: InlB B-repeat-containing protein [Clostridiales Family XIII bacterium]|nr:InlB B-repeat-containing protein [Clostridiales Family XIII bacterium]
MKKISVIFKKILLCTLVAVVAVSALPGGFFQPDEASACIIFCNPKPPICVPTPPPCPPAKPDYVLRVTYYPCYPGAFYNNTTGARNPILYITATTSNRDYYSLEHVVFPRNRIYYEGYYYSVSSTLPGYDFVGWNTKPDGAGRWAIEGKRLFADCGIPRDQGVTLYAVWKAKTCTYTVSYNANGGTGAPGQQTKIQGSPLTLSSVTPTRTGYDFMGWATNSSATVAAYLPGGVYTNDASVVLYAVWKSKPCTYTVSYNANGGTGAPGQQTKTQGAPLTLSSVTPTRTGYDFMGWATSSSATAATYLPGGVYTNDASVVLYAVWKSKPCTYTVSYNANGGTGAPGQQTKIQGTPLTLSSVTPTRTGYDFMGWATNSSATVAAYLPGGVYTNDASVVLYAVWKTSAYSISLIYDPNGGEGARVTDYGDNRGGFNIVDQGYSKTVIEGGLAKRYVVWYYFDESGRQYFPGDIVTLTKTTTIYAQYRPADTTRSVPPAYQGVAPGYGIASIITSIFRIFF